MSDQDGRSNEEDEEHKLFEFVDFPSSGSLQTCFHRCTSYRKRVFDEHVFVKNVFPEKESHILKGSSCTLLDPVDLDNSLRLNKTK